MADPRREGRVTDTTATLIDNIFTNNLNDNALNGILTTDISDHFSVFHISKAHDVICANGNIDNQLYKRVISEYNIKIFTSAIQATNWKFIYACSNPNDAYNKFIETYNNILNTNMPLKKFKIKRSTNEKPWLTNEIIHDINRKNKMYKQLKVQGDKSLEIHYKKFKNNLCNIIKQEEKKILQGYIRQKQKQVMQNVENP